MNLKKSRENLKFFSMALFRVISISLNHSIIVKMNYSIWQNKFFRAGKFHKIFYKEDKKGDRIVLGEQECGRIGRSLLIATSYSYQMFAVYHVKTSKN